MDVYFHKNIVINLIIGIDLLSTDKMKGTEIIKGDFRDLIIKNHLERSNYSMPLNFLNFKNITLNSLSSLNE